MYKIPIVILHNSALTRRYGKVIARSVEKYLDLKELPPTLNNIRDTIEISPPIFQEIATNKLSGWEEKLSEKEIFQLKSAAKGADDIQVWENALQPTADAVFGAVKEIWSDF